MPLIDVNLDNTSDRLLPISVGTHVMEILDIETISKGTGEGENPKGPVVVVTMKINNPDSDEHERRGWDRLYISNERARIQWKQLCLSAGHDGTGKADTDELIGTNVRAVWGPNNYTDASGKAIEATQVKSYEFDA